MKRVCFNCLVIKHTLQNYKSNKQCFMDVCKMKHHTGLHQVLMKRLSGSNTSISQTDISQSHKSDGVKPTKSKGSYKTEDQLTPPSAEFKDNKEIKSTINGRIKGSSHVYIHQVFPVRIKNKLGLWVETYAMHETGSQYTLITKSMCKELNLQGKRAKINFGTI